MAVENGANRFNTKGKYEACMLDKISQEATKRHLNSSSLPPRPDEGSRLRTKCEQPISNTQSKSHPKVGPQSRNSEVRGRRRVRCVSNPETRRRSIFDEFWKRDSKDASKSGDSAERARLPPPSKPPRPVDVRMFSPPREFSSSLMEHFSRIDNIPPSIWTEVSLPPLPSPLRRYYKSPDTSLGLAGMYPILPAGPRSILHKSTFTHTSNRVLDEHQDERYVPLIDLEQATPSRNLPMPVPLVHTKSFRCHRKELSSSSDICPSVETTSTDSTSTISSTVSRRRIQIDPRVTITEYDDDVPRDWYTETELELFKRETLSLAAQYFSMNPLLAEQYSRVRYDPYTGVARKKALYSLPILNAVSDDAVLQHGQHLQQMLEAEIKKILIVDANKIVLDLFCKSVRIMFPHAQIQGVQTGDSALKLVESSFGIANKASSDNPQPRGFDLIVVDEQLRKRKCQHPGSFGHLGDADISSGTNNVPLTKPKSTSHLSELRVSFDDQPSYCGISGSEVIYSIRLLEDHVYGPNNHQSRSLIIGVSAEINRDAGKLWENGADLVWGKPPPTMGDALRDQILSMLVSKRGNLSPQLGI